MLKGSNHSNEHQSRFEDYPPSSESSYSSYYGSYRHYGQSGQFRAYSGPTVCPN